MIDRWKCHLLWLWPLACLVISAEIEWRTFSAACAPNSEALEKLKNYCADPYASVMESVGDLRQWSVALVARPPEFITAVATLLLTIITFRLATLAENQNRTQRAYIFGGCGETRLVTDDATGAPILSARGFRQVSFQPGFRNYGQTPAWVLSLEWIIQPMPPPAKPEFGHINRTIISDSAQPDGGIVRPAGDWFVIEMDAPSVLYYGRFHYRDIFGDLRHSSFIYEIRDDGVNIRIHSAHPDYLHWN